MQMKVCRGGQKSPVDVKGLPARVTTFGAATRSSGAEALLIVTRGRIRSVVATAGTMNVYLSGRAEFRLIEPKLAEPEVAGGGA